MASQAEQIQILYEISMTIGVSLDLDEMLRTSLSTMLRKLSCTAATVLALDKEKAEPRCTEIFSIPRRPRLSPAHQATIAEITASLAPSPKRAFVSRLPFVDAGPGESYHHILELPDFGLLLIFKADQPLDPEILKSLKPITQRLANACNACLVQQTLKRSEERHRMLIETMNDGFAVLDNEGRLAYVNQKLCAMIDRSANDLVGRRLAELIDPESRPVLDKKLKARARGEAEPYELQWLKEDGTTVVASVAPRARFTDTGECLGSFAVIHDITERKRAEQERLDVEVKMQQSHRLESLGFLAGGIAHDFNNLLVGILGNADLALADLAPESPARESIRDVVTTAKRAADLVRQLLAYAGKGRFVIEPIDLRAVVSEMGHLIEVTVSKRATLEYDLETEVPPIVGDATQIRQVIINLITNASEAIGERDGVISIRAGAKVCEQADLAAYLMQDELPAGPYAFIAVSDTGMGMDEATRERIFDPFFTTKFTGRGLGLAAVLGIVRSHQGAIKVESEPGKQTTIEILFPSAEDAIVTAPQASLDRADRTRGGIVLLVDDEETVRVVGSRMLERLGFEVVTARDGREALEIFRAEPKRFHCVLLDLTMPHIDGDVCLAELRRIDPDARVILSSGYTEHELMARFAGRGFAGFVQKPYSLAGLREKIDQALGEPET